MDKQQGIYRVRIHETTGMTFNVMADDEREAARLAQESYLGGSDGLDDDREVVFWGVETIEDLGK